MNIFLRLYKRLRYIQKVRKRIDEYVLLELPPVANLSSQSLYPYYWPAENLQYYGFKLVRVSGWFGKFQRYCLKDSNFGIIQLNLSYDNYFSNVIKSAERALIRKSAKNGYFFKEISYDQYRNDILEINTSKSSRQGRPMTEDYIHPVNRDAIVKPFNQHIHTYGCFEPQGKLVAYYMFEKFTNYVHVNKGIGHQDHLNMGVMNFLFANCVADLSEKYPDLFLIYGCIDKECSDGLSRYKKHVGCQEKTLIYQGTRSEFETLMYFRNNYHLHGDSGLNFVMDYIIKNRVND